MNHTNFIDECTDVSSYFSSSSCNWKADSRCTNVFNGEEGALRCLLEGNGDVAFMGYETFKKFKGKLSKDHKLYGDSRILWRDGVSVYN